LQTVEAEAKRIINALKTGVIPDADLDLLCVGRESIVKEFKRCLELVEHGGSCTKFISGEYGSGKSFLLGKAGQLAIRHNFAISRVQIGKSMHLNNPDIFYYGIMHNIASGTIHNGENGFEELFSQWLDKLRNNPSKAQASKEISETITELNNYNSSFARAFLTYIKARVVLDEQLAAAAASWIKGEKNIPAALKARIDVKGDIEKSTSMDSLKAFMHLLRHIGYSGLVILVDELELIMGLRSDIRRGCYENLRYIVDSCGNGDFGNCLFVFAGTDALFSDEEKGLKSYHALYQRLGEPDSKSSMPARDMRRPLLRLEKLTNDELMILSERIIDIHKTAYGWKPSITVSPQETGQFSL
jgi:hypothetical protein